MATAAAVRSFQPSARILTRSKGDSAAGKAAYNARTRIENERTGKVYSFGHLPNRAISEHFFPAANAPEWARTREGYWNGVEMRENRSDSQLAMDWVIPLPSELEANPVHARLALTDFIRENFQRKGYGADLVFHPAHDHGDERNFHAHLMVGIRRFERGGTWVKEKDGVPDAAELTKLRERMTGKLNKFLRDHGYEIELDQRSYEDRGIDREATLHLGKHAAALERRGVQTEVGNLNREVQARNAERDAMAQNALEQEREAEQFERPRVRVREIEAVEIETVLERARQADEVARQEAKKRADRDLARGTSMAQHARELMSAVRRLFVTMGAVLGNVIQIERGDVHGQGGTYRTEAVEARRAAQEQEQAIYERQRRHATEQAAKLVAATPPKQRNAADIEAEARERAEMDARAEQQRQEKEAEAERSREAWMQQSGGVEQLQGEHLNRAKRSYAEWVQNNPGRGKGFGFEQYVSYTQRKQAERAREPAANVPAGKRETLLEKLEREAAEQGKNLTVRLSPGPERRLERVLGIERKKRRPDEPEF